MKQSKWRRKSLSGALALFFFCSALPKALVAETIPAVSRPASEEMTENDSVRLPGKAGQAGQTVLTTKVLLPHTRFATRYYVIDSALPGPTVFIVGGVHGNEPAGAYAADGIRHWTVANGRLVVVPCANVPGLAANKRLIPGLETNLSNLNRNYPKAGETNGARGELAQTIWQLALDYKPDWILDLHEGYDFHQLNEKSVGSSIICYPLTNGQEAAALMLSAVNQTITNSILKFVQRNMPVDGSLARAAGEHLHVPGMTVETTTKQPLAQRVEQQEIIVHCLLAHLGMMPADFNFSKSPNPALSGDVQKLIAVPKIVAALYKGPGTGGKGPPNLLKQLNVDGESSLTEVSPDEIRQGILTNYDVVIFAGGSGSAEATALGEAGCAEVNKFVGNGGGYVGICAGSYLAACNYPWSLHIINAKTLSSKWNRGRADLKMELTPTGSKILGGNTNVQVIYHNGPVVGPGEDPTLPPYEALAFFRTEVAEHDTPKGIQKDSPAIFAGQFKAGKVVCISPHPEQTEGLEYIVPHALKWVAPVAQILKPAE